MPTLLHYAYQGSSLCLTLKKEQPWQFVSTRSLDVIDYAKEDSDCRSIWVGIIKRHFEGIGGHRQACNRSFCLETAGPKPKPLELFKQDQLLAELESSSK